MINYIIFLADGIISLWVADGMVTDDDFIAIYEKKTTEVEFIQINRPIIIIIMIKYTILYV